MDGTPQRPPLRICVSALIMGVACLLLLARSAHPASAQSGFIANGDFEEGLTGWGTTASASMAPATDGVDGSNAVRVTAAVAGVVQLRSHWWLSAQVTPGAAYGLEAWLLDDSADVSLSLYLQFLDEDGTRIERRGAVPLGGDSDEFRRVIVEGSAPPDSAYARVVVEANVDGPGASFAVDAVTLAQVGAAPVVTPTVQPAPPPAATSTTTPRATASPSGTATPSPTPVVRPIAPVLWNPRFEDGTDGWSASRGWLEVAPSAGAGDALVLRANGSSTAWVEQAVLVAPGGWYAASATLAPIEGVRAAWVRIAWYASDDASGAQMSTDDSEAISVDGLAILAAPGAPLTTGPVQAPATARSARVRILLQPSIESGAALAITDVGFGASQAPAPTPTTTPTPLATVAPTTPTTTSPSPSASTPGTAPSGAGGSPAPAAPTHDPAAPDLEGQGLLRITEVMPDPIQPGRDADYEWVELNNLGERGVDLAGMVLRDLHASTALPPLVVPPGASVVIAAALAEVDADTRVEGAFGNGLGNEGDRLELLDASGRVVDAFEYGSDDLAVSPGESVHRWFAEAGQLEGAAVGPSSPGVHEPVEPSASADAPDEGSDEASVAATEEPEASEGANASEGSDSMAWMLLIAVGGGALGGVAAQRIGRS